MRVKKVKSERFGFGAEIGYDEVTDLDSVKSEPKPLEYEVCAMCGSTLGSVLLDRGWPECRNCGCI